MRRIDIVVALLVAIIPLVAVARRANVAYPIVLVVAGLVLGFVPHLPHIELPPAVVLLVFLPPLLYTEALTAPAGVMRTEAGIIRTLVIGLVVATMTGVAIVAHAIVPHMSWAAAFVLGAVVAPTDAVAFSPLASRLGVPRRTIAIVQAEGLLNDASALVFYSVAVAAVVSGTFSLRVALLQFVISCVAAIALGVALGYLVAAAWRRIRDIELQVAISILAPFLAYLPAHALGLSGVLAVVTLGLYVSRYAPSVLTPEARLRSNGFWETAAFLMNALIFLLVGLQLHAVLARLAVYSRLRLVLMALAIGTTVIALRFVWLLGQRYVLRLRHRIAERTEDEWKHRLIASWAGFRGGVSLAAALAIPATTASGDEFPRRALIIFITFGVIVMTLVGQGLTLPWLIERLRLPQERGTNAALRAALVTMAQVALTRLHAHERKRGADPVAIELLRRRYEARKRRFAGDGERPHPGSGAGAAEGYDVVARDLLSIERSTLAEMRDRGEVEGSIFSDIETMLDLEEIELDRLASVAERSSGAT